MASNAQLAFAIRAVNEASKTLKDVQGDISGITDKAEKSKGPLGGMASGLGGVATVAGGFVVASGLQQLGGFLMSAAQGAAADEQATARLNQALKLHADATGASADQLSQWTDEVNDAIDKGAKLAFTDDQMRDSYQALLAATGSHEEALKRQAAAMDLARGAGIPLETATKMLGKITAENVEVFKKMGITIGENATEAEALAAVEAKFGGQAEVYANSTAGHFEQTKIQMAELKEKIGAQLLPVMAGLGAFLVNDLVPALNRLADAIGPRIKAAAEFFNAEVMPLIEQFMAFLQEQWAKFQIYYDEEIQPALQAVENRIQDVIEFIRVHWPEIEAIIRPILELVKNNIETTFAVITGVLNIFIQLLQGDFAGAWEAAKGVVQAVLDGLVDSIGLFMELIEAIIRGAGPLLMAAGFAAFDALRNGILDLWNNHLWPFIQSLPQRYVDAWLALPSMLYNVGFAALDGFRLGANDLVTNHLIPFFDGIPNMLLGATKGAWNAVADEINGAIPDSVGFSVSAVKVAGKTIVPGMNISIPLPNPIPHLAEGGIVRATPGGVLALLAEGGQDEAVVPLPRGGSGRFGGDIILNFFGLDVLNNPTHRRQVALALRDEMLRAS